MVKNYGGVHIQVDTGTRPKNWGCPDTVDTNGLTPMAPVDVSSVAAGNN